jgi:hypothetical protein
MSIGWFVGTGSGADVEYHPGSPKSLLNGRRDTGIRLAKFRVVDPDAVI